VLAGALGLADFLERAIDQASSGSSQHVSEQLEPMIERGVRSNSNPYRG
jgi:hypothetical protein